MPQGRSVHGLAGRSWRRSSFLKYRGMYFMYK
jgi:hypothetical protein